MEKKTHRKDEVQMYIQDLGLVSNSVVRYDLHHLWCARVGDLEDYRTIR